ncbi:class I SAM-dependent methyltransferase [Alteraurantiacibacter buctensis]|uniref:Class I SAM-dependent methyltransferase n=1 Tax=Alteraurantiacibacter buctensis TaxID=1503981 RepID=A0A844YVB6_9SPHN|nr:SAM-dependent methyltransferase [Alteraurantiacibacter buctensis]MXO70838.1 class I SAM-dependent methyltransferase [Alteraurantiacibacter buctensis]
MADGAQADIFRRLIHSTGPISLMQFMGESNARYYSQAEALGEHGDFITAPEVSQMFGELIGLWLADLWIRAGRTEPVHYVELGPGRGFLARDARRAMKRYGLEPRMHLVEASVKLRDEQLVQVPDAFFHHDLSTVPVKGPMLLVANEFLDALPIRQLVMTGDGWREVMVGLEGDEFVLVAGRQPMDVAVPEARRQAPVGTVIETCPGAAATLFEVAGRLTGQGGVALFIDYGYLAPRTGSTLQAIRGHQKVDPFAMPGEADLTAHVDFDQMKQVALSRGARWMGSTTQGAWLTALGIHHRAESLAEFAPQHREVLMRARDRLVLPDQMGELFKVMALAGPTWPDGSGFGA